MPENMSPYEAPPDDLEIRRDALLLRIVELRESVKNTGFNQELVSKELEELDRKVQSVRGSKDMTLFEEMFDGLEGMVDKARKNRGGGSNF